MLQKNVDSILATGLSVLHNFW